MIQQRDLMLAEQLIDERRRQAAADRLARCVQVTQAIQGAQDIRQRPLAWLRRLVIIPQKAC